ncbi:aldo-keto reductase family protein [Aquipluma nitroreducens]|uniref:hypothetical protein n=1 Tax=Aquipluma nitroreducens TaxID=2010828 RepID=UPI00296F1346|nr:hypothetical protein [Aquipluma nitroreducens]
MKEVAEKLKMKSADTAARWCIDRNIEIMSLGNKRVVSEFDFKLSFEKPLIDVLKRKYGESWPMYYEVYKSEDVTKYYELEKDSNVMDYKSSTFNPDTFLNEIGYGKSKNT